MDDEIAEIEVTTSYIWFSFLQALCRPVIEIDGEPHSREWGTHFFEVCPGEHTIKVYHRWIILSQAYASSISVNVPEGETIRLHWRTGWFTTAPGKWSEL